MTNGRHPEPSFEVVLVTPALAAEWLEANTHNRPEKWRKIKQMAGAMRRGEWKLNGQAIQFDYNGVLIDGQNRLWAICEAETPVKMLVGTNLDPEAQATIDIGTPRSLADALALAGEKNVVKLASTIRWAYLWERFITADAPMDHRVDPPTLQQLLAFHDTRKSRLHIAVKEGSKIHDKFRDITASAAATAWYIFHELDWEDCNDFFYKLSVGASLTEDNPIFILRRWLTNNTNKTRDKARTDIVLAVIVKAWNAYRDGTRIELLVWRGGGSRPERFPVAR